MADFDIPTGRFSRLVFNFLFTSLLDAYDVNVTPDKRTILLHSEGNLILVLKVG
jgi:DNA mismatch repair protein PMS2